MTANNPFFTDRSADLLAIIPVVTRTGWWSAGRNRLNVAGVEVMRILYIFPHPDDESFGPARAIAAQRRQGHDVFLLTLTRGEATKVRHNFGWTLEQMGEARYRELLDVRTTLDLTDIRV